MRTPDNVSIAHLFQRRHSIKNLQGIVYALQTHCGHHSAHRRHGMAKDRKTHNDALTTIIHEASVFDAGSLFPAPSVSEEYDLASLIVRRSTHLRPGWQRQIILSKMRGCTADAALEGFTRQMKRLPAVLRRS